MAPTHQFAQSRRHARAHDPFDPLLYPLPAGLMPGWVGVDTFINLVGDILAAQMRFVRSCLDVWGRTVASAGEDRPWTAPTDRAVDVSEDAVQARAYELYMQRGRQPGHEVEDWERARAELGSATAAPSSSS